jgi:hypothetical protein
MNGIAIEPPLNDSGHRLRTVSPTRRRMFRFRDWKQDKGRFLQKEAAFSIDTRE